MINRVVLVGRMTRDPELRRTNSGATVTSFTLALNRNYNSADGQQADYINCVVWNKIAENVEKYCSKGSLVGVEGKLQSRSYENAQGQKVYVVEVRCDSVQFLETRSSREGREQHQGRNDNFGYNPQANQPMTPPQNNYQEMTKDLDFNKVDLEKDFDNSFSSFDIMDDDIQF